MMSSVAGPAGRRMAREERTIRAMVAIYCNGLHVRRKAPCEECSALLDYARRRLRLCLFRADKPTCANCAVHCYRPDMRKRVRAVMKYAGPRMAYRHPVMALLHLLDGKRAAPRRARKGS